MMAKLGVLQKLVTAGLVVVMALALLPVVTVAEEAPKKTIELKVSDVKFEEVGRFGQFTYTREFHDHGGSGATIIVKARILVVGDQLELQELE
jgi:hypothetical protein